MSFNLKSLLTTIAVFLGITFAIPILPTMVYAFIMYTEIPYLVMTAGSSNVLILAPCGLIIISLVALVLAALWVLTVIHIVGGFDIWEELAIRFPVQEEKVSEDRPTGNWRD